MKNSLVPDLRNASYGAALLTWAFAGLGSALQAELSPGVFSVAAKVGAGFLLLALLLELLRRFVERDAISRLFEARPVKRAELNELRNLSARFVPQVPPLSQVEAVFEAGRRCFWFVESTKRSAGGRSSKRLGFFSLIRLTDPAVEMFGRNSLNGFQLDRSHIAGPRKKVAPGLYIGGLGTAGFRAKGWLVQHLRARIDQFFEDGGKVVFARPVTEDGLRLAEGLDFMPTTAQVGLNNVYRLDNPLH